MPVPDKVIFGPDSSDGQLNYGDVRKLTGNDRFVALKARLDSFLISQTNELGKPENGEGRVYSPFPLFLLTCVAAETLGKALFRPAPSMQMSDEDAQREGFLSVVTKIDKHFSRPLGEDDKKDYDGLWGKDEHKKVASKGIILYRFGRHTMAHGFRGKGVYLTEDDDTPNWKFEDGAVVLNPYWFWRRFCGVYEGEWSVLFKDKEPTSSRKRSAGEFLKEILT